MALRSVIGISALIVAIAACSGSITSDLLAPPGGGSGFDSGVPGSGSGTGSRLDSGASHVDAHIIEPGFDATTPPREVFVAPPPVDSWVAPPDGVQCGATPCAEADVCCLQGGGMGGGETATCIPKGGDCTGGISFSCLSTSDCNGNECCVTFNPYGVSCSASAHCPSGETPICNVANNGNDCPNNEDCQPAGSSGYGYCAPQQGNGSGFPGH